MKDRFFSWMGTVGFVLTLSVLIPSASVFASGGNPCGGTGCATDGAGLELRCAQTQPAGACTGTGCSCISGRDPFTAMGNCNCIK